MKNPLCLLCVLSASVVISGCSTPRGNEAVPSSTLKIPTPAGVAELVLPKDQSIERLHYERTGTNIVVDLHNVRAHNSPDVVSAGWSGAYAAYQAQQDAINARLDHMMQMLMWAGNKAGAAYGIPPTAAPVLTNTVSP